MTIKELAAVMDESTIYTILIGPDQEVVVSKEDKTIMGLLGDVEVDRAMVNTENRLAIFASVDLRREPSRRLEVLK